MNFEFLGFPQVYPVSCSPSFTDCCYCCFFTAIMVTKLLPNVIKFVLFKFSHGEYSNCAENQREGKKDEERIVKAERRKEGRR